MRQSHAAKRSGNPAMHNAHIFLAKNVLHLPCFVLKYHSNLIRAQNSRGLSNSLLCLTQGLNHKEVGRKMNKYEILFILSADLEDAPRDAAIEKYKTIVTSAGGEVENVDKWGTKKLAYPINYKSEGYYVLMTFSSPAGIPAEIERQMRISDEVIRFLVTRKDN